MIVILIAVVAGAIFLGFWWEVGWLGDIVRRLWGGHD